MKRKIKFKNFSTIGKEELKAVTDVIKSGVLSGFVAGYPNGFNGGKYNQLFEKKIKSFYKCKYAIALNSWTSGLIAAVGALDISPGDEVIVSPWTMSATATAIMHWNAIPVFADIEPKTFSIDPAKVKKLITKKTKAIITVDIFGHPSKVKELKRIVKNKNIKIITDSAQSPYSFCGKKLAGTLSDIGGFSLNCHKHIQTGEGGVVVTNNKAFADRIKLIRNHAEAIVDKKKISKINNLIGYNFRLGEMEAAIGIQQLKKLKGIVKEKQLQVKYLNKKLKKLGGLILPTTEKNCTHSYYTYPLVLDLKKVNFTRSQLMKGLQNEGLEGFVEGYTNIHLLPMYRKKIAYGSNGFPWKKFSSNIEYKKGLCPIAEELHTKSFLNFEICKFHLTKKDLNLIIKNFTKVWNNLSTRKTKNFV